MSLITKKHIFIILIMIFSIVLSGCQNEERAFKKINLANQMDTPINKNSVPKEMVFAISVGLSPLKSLNIYQDFIKLLENNLGYPIRLVQKKSSSEIIRLMKEGGIDAAYIDVGGYLHAKEEYVGEIIALPQINGENFHQSLIIVNKDEEIKEFKQLEGKKFAFTDPWSIDGTVYPMALIKELKGTPETFFANYFYSFSYDKAIAALQAKTVNAVSINSNIFDLLVRQEAINDKSFKTIEKSWQIPNNPIIVRTDLDQGLKEDLQKVLLSLGNEKEEKRVMSVMNFDRFVIADEGLFDQVHNLLKQVFNYD
ncbi:MAG: hypothetical protein JM58_05115 [Peptococcaceae bacterium BICA1-8]|nr:MAG: hypothetical protein JM58_05115 [Peptococcaceae bacterium BICA1-8]